MNIFVKKFGSQEAPIKFSNIDEEEKIPTFKQRVSERTNIPIDLIRLIDDGAWGSLLLENGKVDDISTNLVHLVEMKADRSWDQFFFFVKPFGGERFLVEGDFLETVASVKSRLLLDQEPRVSDSQIGLIHKWSILRDEIAFDDEKEDIAVGCTLNLFIREPQQCKLVFKSTCYKNFTLIADLQETPVQLMQRIEAQENLAVDDLILMNLNSSASGELIAEKSLAEQGISNESIIALDIKTGSLYFLKVEVSLEDIINVKYNFNDTIEQIKVAVCMVIAVPETQQEIFYKGRLLEDDFKVYQYGICIGDTLKLVVRNS